VTLLSDDPVRLIRLNGLPRTRRPTPEPADAASKRTGALTSGAFPDAAQGAVVLVTSQGRLIMEVRGLPPRNFVSPWEV